MFVCPVVVDYQVDIEILGNIFVNVLEKAEVFLVTVSAAALRENLACSRIQGRKQCRCAVPDVVMGHTFNVSQAHGQEGLSPIEGLNLTFFVHAQDHGVIGRVEVQTDDIAHFFNEKGIRGDFEMPLAMRLEPEGIPYPVDRRAGNMNGIRHRPGRPMGSSRRSGLKRLANELGDLLIGNGTGSPGPQFVMESGKPLLQKSPAPHADRLRTVIDLLGNVFIGYSFSGHDNDPCPRHQSMGQRTRGGNSFQLLFLTSGDDQRVSELERFPFKGQNSQHLEMLRNEVRARYVTDIYAGRSRNFATIAQEFVEICKKLNKITPRDITKLYNPRPVGSYDNRVP